MQTKVIIPNPLLVALDIVGMVGGLALALPVMAILGAALLADKIMEIARS